MFQNVIIKILLIVLLIFSYSCDDLIVEPINIEQGRTDYNWKVDTLLTNPFEYVNNISGYENNIWAYGSAGFWQFDDNKWNLNSFRLPNCWKMICTSPLSGWVSQTDDGGFYKLNGKTWELYDRAKYPDYKRQSIYDFYSDGYSELIAVGCVTKTDHPRYGIIMKFINNKWEYIKGPDNVVEYYRIEKDINGKFYIFAITQTVDYSKEPEFHLPELYKIYEYDGDKLKEIYSEYDARYISKIGNEIYFAEKNKLYKYERDKFNLVYDINEPGYDVYFNDGRSIKDIFLFGYSNVDTQKRCLMHYNGNNIEILDTRKMIRSIYFSKNKLFILSTNFENINGLSAFYIKVGELK